MDGADETSRARYSQTLSDQRPEVSSLGTILLASRRPVSAPATEPPARSWHSMVIEERPKDTNRNGASAALRPRAAAAFVAAVVAICVNARRNFVDRARSIWHESRSHHDLGCAADAQFRGRSSIITAHAKMQFKLQVHVISRSRRGKRFRPVDRPSDQPAGRPIDRSVALGSRFRMIQSNVYMRCSSPRLGNARPTHRYIHQGAASTQTQKRRACLVKRGTRHHARRTRREAAPSKKRPYVNPARIRADPLPSS